MRKEIKTVPFEMKLNEEKRTIEGYASTFGNRDLVGDIIQPGAFRKTLQERKDRIKVLWQHFEPIGRPIHIEEDSKGLYVNAYISKTALGNDALELARDQVIDRFSIGYDVIQDQFDEQTNSRLLKELKLYEFSLVTFPANEEAAITNVKSVHEFTDLLNKTALLDVTKLMKTGTTLNEQQKNAIDNAIQSLSHLKTIIEPEQTKRSVTTQTPAEPLLKALGADKEIKEMAIEILKHYRREGHSNYEM